MFLNTKFILGALEISVSTREVCQWEDVIDLDKNSFAGMVKMKSWLEKVLERIGEEELKIVYIYIICYV